jgi:hypothetical protein
MQNRILCALIAMAMAASAAAQAVQPPPGAGMPPAPLPGGLPPPPPGCVGNVLPPPPPQAPAPVNDDELARGLQISSAQASKVQKVLARQQEQAQRLGQQRRDLDTQTCKDLRGILGDQGMARWAAAAPPRPRGDHRQFVPDHGLGGMLPPAPPPQGD